MVNNSLFPVVIESRYHEWMSGIWCYKLKLYKNYTTLYTVYYKGKYCVSDLDFFPILSCFTGRILPNFNACKIPIKAC